MPRTRQGRRIVAEKKRCICAFIKNVQSPGLDLTCPLHPNAKPKASR
jgi:hypothetical protein